MGVVGWKPYFDHIQVKICLSSCVCVCMYVHKWVFAALSCALRSPPAYMCELVAVYVAVCIVSCVCLQRCCVRFGRRLRRCVCICLFCVCILDMLDRLRCFGCVWGCGGGSRILLICLHYFSCLRICVGGGMGWKPDFINMLAA